MRYSPTFTNGVIKCRESRLLSGKIERMTEGSLDDAIKILKDSDFGSPFAEGASDANALISAEERAINSFIREYAPDTSTERFLLADCDFHNAEALVKCKYAGADEDSILGAEGSFTVEALKKAVYDGALDGLPKELCSAIREAEELFDKGEASGFAVDCLFKAKLFEYMQYYALDGDLIKILADRADRANVATFVRSGDEKLAERMFVVGGKLPFSRIKALFEGKDVKRGKMPDWVKDAISEYGSGRPLSQLEKRADDFPLELLNKFKYDMAGIQPFLIYILRRRAEAKNVRIITVGLASGLAPSKIKQKLRLY